MDSRLGDFQMVQATIANMAADIAAARLLVYHAAWLVDRGRPATQAASSAKLFATEAAARAASEAVSLYGNRGYSSEYPVERYYRDIKGLQIYEGASNIQRIILARELIWARAVIARRQWRFWRECGGFADGAFRVLEPEERDAATRADLQRAATGRSCSACTQWAYAESPFHSSALRGGGLPSRPAQDARRPAPHPVHDARGVDGVAGRSSRSSATCPPPTQEHAIRYHLTSGTSGRTPLRVLDGMKDWEWIAEMWCYGFWGFGVRPEDIVFFAFGYGSFIGFWGAHYACEKIGALVMPGGAQTTEARVKQIVEMGDHRLLDADLRAAALAAGARRWASTSPKTARSTR